MHGSSIERLTDMGIGADVPFVAHFPSNRRFPQRNRHLSYQGLFYVLALLDCLSNGDDSVLQ